MCTILTFPTKLVPMLSLPLLQLCHCSTSICYCFSYLPIPFGLTSDNKYGNRLCISSTLPAIMISTDCCPRPVYGAIHHLHTTENCHRCCQVLWHLQATAATSLLILICNKQMHGSIANTHPSFREWTLVSVAAR
jgi:hypothetical protein